MELHTESMAETQKIARMLARETMPRLHGAAVVALEGDLGAGKTTFAQGFARALGVKESVLSPTFVLMKIYSLKQEVHPHTKSWCGGRRSKKQGFKYLVHIDCYRIRSPKDLINLGLKDILKDRDAVVLIEWADRIKRILPRDTIRIRFKHSAKSYQRLIVIS